MNYFSRSKTTPTESLIIFFFCVIKLLLHLIADKNSGFQADEFLHIETGKHLAFGYMEFPPLIGFLAFLQNLFQSNSIYVHHLFAHLAGILIIIYVAKTTIDLGGKEIAIIITLSSIIIGPGFGRSQQLFQPVVFSQLFWVLNFYNLTRFVKYLDKKSLWALTFFTFLGFSVKYDALFFVFGAGSLFLFKRTREALMQLSFWKNCIVVVLLLTPNMVWQHLHDWPALQMFDRLYETQLDKASRIEILGQILLAINPITSLLVVLPGVIFLLKTKHRVFQQLGITILLSFLLLIFQKGKAYYFFPVILTILPFGGLFLAQYLARKAKWVCYAVTSLFLLGAALIPFGMPVYTFQHYLQSIYKYESKTLAGAASPIKYEEYYATEKWTETMKRLSKVYENLPENEKKNCIVWGKHYGQAGAINMYRNDYNLPKAFSCHGSYYNWMPKGKIPDTIIALSYQVGDFFNPYFEDVKIVDSIYNPYADNEEELYQIIYVCKKPKQSFDQLNELFRERIFE